MNSSRLTFDPPRRFGLLFQGIVTALLGGISLWNIWQMTEAALGIDFLRHLIFALLPLLAIPFLVYRMRALQQGHYSLERDGIRLRWGLRAVDIPMDHVTWVHARNDLLTSLPMPPVRWPGAILGQSIRPLPGSGRVEFMASNNRKLVLIGTPQKVYAISPEDQEGFLQAYQQMVELGSINPIPAHDEFPVFLLGQLWQKPTVRVRGFAALFFSLTLVAWVILVIPTLPGVVMGPERIGAETVILPAAALLLIPFLNLVFQALDWGVGLFLYRRQDRQALGSILFSTSVATALLFLFTLWIILRNN